MIIDVELTCEHGEISARSEAAQYSETRPANLTLSKKAGEKVEGIEAVGDLHERIVLQARQHRPDGSYTYRTIVDPFVPTNFNAAASFLIVKHFCYLAHSRLRPPRSYWRLILRLDRFRVCVNIPHYSVVPKEQKKVFEKLLRQRLGQVKVQSIDK